MSCFSATSGSLAKGGLSSFNREFAVNLAKTTSDSIKVHCYVSQSDKRSRKDAKKHGVNLITARSIPGSCDPIRLVENSTARATQSWHSCRPWKKVWYPSLLSLYKLQSASGCILFMCSVKILESSKQRRMLQWIQSQRMRRNIKVKLRCAKQQMQFSQLDHGYNRGIAECLPDVKVDIITPGILQKFF